MSDAELALSPAKGDPHLISTTPAPESHVTSQVTVVPAGVGSGEKPNILVVRRTLLPPEPQAIKLNGDEPPENADGLVAS